ncbi:hypothetical protein LEN26_017673 [Aphanomyces euteiches]|nr:hypothetical protein LEN26_017673 [Aphanomyces euteiches]
MFDKKRIKSVMRGSSLVSVATSLGIIAVSWLDGTVVNMLSTAGQQQSHLSIAELEVKLSNKNASHSSVCTTSTCKVLTAMINYANDSLSHQEQVSSKDIAITNLYVLYTICEPVDRRDSHLHFQTKLANQMLFETDWTLFSETQVPMEYSSVPMTQSAKALKKAAAEDKAAADKQAEVSYGQRMRRYCVVCYYERSKELIKTQWCDVHQVYLCTKAYLQSEQAVPAHLCPYPEWSCWDKFHSFYQPKGLFKKDGKMDRGNELYKMKKKSEKEYKTSSAKKTLVLV